MDHFEDSRYSCRDLALEAKPSQVVCLHIQYIERVCGTISMLRCNKLTAQSTKNITEHVFELTFLQVYPFHWPRDLLVLKFVIRPSQLWYLLFLASFGEHFQCYLCLSRRDKDLNISATREGSSSDYCWPSGCVYNSDHFKHASPTVGV